MEAFDKEFRDLMDLCSNIMETSEKNKVRANNEPNPIIKYLNRYKKAYNSTGPEVHQDYVLSVYRKNRKAILAGASKPEWLTTGSATIQFGEELKKPPKDICIRLSAIHTTSIKLRDETKESLEGLPDDALDNCPEVNYPEKLLLHVYRLCRDVAPKAEEPRLSEIIREIESDLGISAGAEVTSQAGGMIGMMASMQSMMKNMGVDLPSNGMPTPDTFGDIFTKLTSNPQAGDMARALLKGVDLEKHDTIMPTLVNNLQNSEIGKQMMADIGPKIAEIAGPEFGSKLAFMAGKNVAEKTEVEEPKAITYDDDDEEEK